jgi:hypothetical protein
MGPLPNVGYDFENGTWSFCADMPTNRQGFGVATVNDIIYVVGGYFSNYPFPDDTFFFVNQTGANECYTPLGYGSVHYTPSPSPTPTPTEAPSPTPTATATPTAVQTQTTTIVAIAAVVIAAVVMSTAVYLRKHNT